MLEHRGCREQFHTDSKICSLSFYKIIVVDMCDFDLGRFKD